MHGSCVPRPSSVQELWGDYGGTGEADIVFSKENVCRMRLIHLTLIAAVLLLMLGMARPALSNSQQPTAANTLLMGSLVSAAAQATAAPPTDTATQWDEQSVTYNGVSYPLLVYRPADYPAQAPYPVVYLLHGVNQTPELWRTAQIEQQANTHQIVVVAVAGEDADQIPSWYSRQSNIPSAVGQSWPVSFYDWFFSGVLPWVEANYQVRSDAGGRAIAGFSMGGKGALSLAGHRPDLFAAAASFSGVMDLRDQGQQFRGDAVPNIYGPIATNRLRYAADSPIELAANLKGLRLLLFHGTADTVVNIEQGRRMHAALEALGYPHSWTEVPNLDHELSTDALAQTFESFAATFRSDYLPPIAWNYRLADATSQQIYGMTISKTNPLTWTEVLSVTESGFTVRSGDAITITTAAVYAPQAAYSLSIGDLGSGTETSETRIVPVDGRLTVNLPAGNWQLRIGAIPPTPTPVALTPTPVATETAAASGPAEPAASSGPDLLLLALIGLGVIGVAGGIVSFIRSRRS